MFETKTKKMVITIKQTGGSWSRETTGDNLEKIEYGHIVDKILRILGDKIKEDSL